MDVVQRLSAFNEFQKLAKQRFDISILDFNIMGHDPAAEYASSTADLVYGVNLEGNIVHVSQVPPGSACKCKCPECDGDLIAKKGEKLAHHFAHATLVSCRGGPETALHLLAKQIVKDRLRINLPEVSACFGKQSRVLHKAAEIKFDHAILEPRT